MSNLRRVKSIDLQVLRSILNEEVIDDVNPGLNTDSLDQIDEPKLLNDDKEIVNPSIPDKIDNKKCKRVMKKKTNNKTHDKPFMVTRIESKHKFTRYNDENNQENVPIDSYKPNISTSIPIYKSIHYKNIVETENRLDRKYEELAKMLNQEVLMKTVSLCDQSMNEARQLIQNSLATSRIVSSFLNDISESGRKIKTYFPVSNNCWHPPSFEECNGQTVGLIGKENSDQKLEENRIDGNNDWNVDQTIGAEIHNPNIDNPTTDIFGMSATTSKPIADKGSRSARQAATDHMLDSDEPFIRQWLTRKNQEVRLERRMKREEMKIERAISMSAIAVKEQRKVASEEAFNKWISTKKNTKLSSNNEKCDSAESDSEIGLPQAGRQPKPLQKLPTRRMMSLPRPNSVATFNMNTNLKMKVAGHQMSLSVNDFKQNSFPSPTKIDYSKYVTKRDKVLSRPQTAFPQARMMDVVRVSKSIESQRVPRQRRIKKLKNKRRELLFENNVEQNNSDNENHEKNKNNEKPNDTYSDRFSITENEHQVLIANSNSEKSIHEPIKYCENLNKDEILSDQNEMSDNISLSSFDFN